MRFKIGFNSEDHTNFIWILIFWVIPGGKWIEEKKRNRKTREEGNLLARLDDALHCLRIVAFVVGTEATETWAARSVIYGIRWSLIYSQGNSDNRYSIWHPFQVLHSNFSRFISRLRSLASLLIVPFFRNHIKKVVDDPKRVTDGRSVINELHR